MEEFRTAQAKVLVEALIMGEELPEFGAVQDNFIHQRARMVKR